MKPAGENPEKRQPKFVFKIELTVIVNVYCTFKKISNYSNEIVKVCYILNVNNN